MSRQLTFEDIPVTDPHTRDEDDDRLAGQNGVIYKFIRDNPGATNAELMNISRSTSGFTARISNIRIWLKEEKGQTIKCEHIKGSIYSYTIVQCPKNS